MNGRPKTTVFFHTHGSLPAVTVASDSDVTIEWGNLSIFTDVAALRSLLAQLDQQQDARTPEGTGTESVSDD